MTKQGKQNIEYTLATHAIEKLTPSKEALRLCEQMENGEISADTAVAVLLERYGLVRAQGNE